MVRPRQVGPDLPSGVRRPDRAVSLGDVRDLPVQTMGFDFDEFDRLISEGTSGAERNPWDLVEDPRTGKLVERRHLGRSGRGAGLDWLWDSHRDSPEAVRAALERDNLQTYERLLRGIGNSDLDEEIADLEEWVDHAPADADDWGSEGREGAKARLKQALEEKARRAQQAGGQPAGAAGAEMRGLTADEAFRQHHAMAGGEPPREGRAHPERVPAPYEPVPPMSEEQKKINREGAKEARRRLNPNSQMAGPDWEAIEEGDYGAGNWWDTVPGMDDLDVFEDPYDPDLRSMDSQMLADMMVAQPEQGYFGGLGDAVQGLTNRVAGMSGQERAALIAALVAAGLITVGSGGTLAPAGAALAGGAGMAALSQ